MSILNAQLSRALVEFQSSLPVIPKNKVAKIVMKSGQSYSYNFADLADIWETIRKPLKENGLAVTQFLSVLGESDVIYTKIWHVSGESEERPFPIPTTGKTPQEAGSVITYYKRYTLSAALGISTEEDDDGKSGNKQPDVEELESEVLSRAKLKINEELEKHSYESIDQKKLFINNVLKHETIDNLNEADEVMSALETENE